jgi:hypothetical protein
LLLLLEFQHKVSKKNQCVYLLHATISIQGCITVFIILYHILMPKQTCLLHYFRIGNNCKLFLIYRSWNNSCPDIGVTVFIILYRILMPKKTCLLHYFRIGNNCKLFLIYRSWNNSCPDIGIVADWLVILIHLLLEQYNFLQ